ncbi:MULTISPECIES: SusF/SusE family outer membrane protein [unclassified Lentimicrobium]|uniref:SusF/SusE family outer membrane protein n=1 Tax=unclassified Lentimicrobium TaxID=2677434 RepID=UPI0015538835|nr:MULTISPECIES: SusF/SusE family outer membrane protein [unclassified Lentimicrobium]NPD46764.1 SusF/SusE family outer membrane protein [Lentimicrobium sp. S6]NPD85667.1 SusF/SusE family outer membrane protein [Lentimicrobium sp. L6]
MKKNNLFKLTHIAWVMLMSFALISTSCTKDDDDDTNDTPPVIVLDGTYVKGAGTALVDFDTKGKMAITRNEVLQEDRAELMDLYVAIKGGTEGFNIITVDGATQTIYGPGADFGMVAEADLDGDEPTLGLYRGSLVESTTPFTVSEDGLYHIAYDSELGVVTVAKVVWGVIGAATPGGWGGSTQLDATFDLNTMTFSGTDIVMTKADFKFRYSNGWKVILSPDFDLGDGNAGIKVNSNYGGAVNALVPGGDNIVNDTPGKYTITVTWSLTGGTVATMVKTGDLETIDYSATELGLVGDGLVVGGEQHNWDVTILTSVPAVDETNYTWTYEGVEVTTAGSFKIREGQDWNGKSIGFPDVTMAGTAAADFEGNGDGNFVPLADGTYDFVLEIDAITELYTLTVKSAGTTDPELYMLGDGCAAGWDNTVAIPFNGTGGVYTLTADLIAGGEGIKFISVLGQWQPQYGMGANAGELAVNDGTGTDPAAIPVEADGTYVITVNTNDMTYSVVSDAPVAMLYVPGAHQGWDPATAPTITDDNADGIFVGIVDITGDELIFKFTSEGSWDGTNYGAGDTDGTLSIDPSAGNLEVPAAGSYEFTVDINALTWSYIAQ